MRRADSRSKSGPAGTKAGPRTKGNKPKKSPKTHSSKSAKGAPKPDVKGDTKSGAKGGKPKKSTKPATGRPTPTHSKPKRASSGTKRPKRPAPQLEGPERLQKLLARAGFGSRRACEDLIREGRVRIDDEVVTELGTKADPVTQDVRVDGNRVRAEQPVYYLANKPRGYLCTSHDPRGRRSVLELVPGERRRIFSVGRLDLESRGAVILTNDGRFTNLLTHPRYGIEKTYQVRVRGKVEDSDVERLRQGVWLSEGRTLPAQVWVKKRRESETELTMTISEGKNRQVRRMFAKFGYKVQSLTRTRIGQLTLRGLGEGTVRPLRPDEVRELMDAARANAQAPAPKGKGPKGSRKRSHGKPDPAAPVNPPLPVFTDTARSPAAGERG